MVEYCDYVNTCEESISNVWVYYNKNVDNDVSRGYRFESVILMMLDNNSNSENCT